MRCAYIPLSFLAFCTASLTPLFLWTSASISLVLASTPRSLSTLVASRRRPSISPRIFRSSSAAARIFRCPARISSWMALTLAALRRASAAFRPTKLRWLNRRPLPFLDAPWFWEWASFSRRGLFSSSLTTAAPASDTCTSTSSANWPRYSSLISPSIRSPSRISAESRRKSECSILACPVSFFRADRARSSALTDAASALEAESMSEHSAETARIFSLLSSVDPPRPRSRRPGSSPFPPPPPDSEAGEGVTRRELLPAPHMV